MEKPVTGQTNLPDVPAATAARPEWLPRPVQLYLDHVVCGLSFRALARREGCNASTVLRMVRRYESRRDDPLLDHALNALTEVTHRLAAPPTEDKDPAAMTVPFRNIDESRLALEGRRVLRRLAEADAFLVIAADLDKAAVLRRLAGGETVTLTTLERSVAEAFAVKDWISCVKSGRVARYEISTAGRSALRRMVEGRETSAPGLAEAQSPFAAQHRDMAEREMRDDTGARRVRVNLSESPVQVLGRRRDKSGQPFLSAELVGAAERLREDFEVAQMGGPRVAQNWERFLTGGSGSGYRGDAGMSDGARAARERVQAALKGLTHPLDDLVLLICCHLHGIETAEMRLGLTARSGKELLRVALTYLRKHYDETYGRSGPLIG